MDKISNFLWKLFSVVMVFCYNAGDKSYAATRIGIGTDFGTGIADSLKEFRETQQIVDSGKEFKPEKDPSITDISENTNSTQLTEDDVYNALADLMGDKAAVDATVYSSTTSTAGSRRVELCPAGYYVSKCGNFSVGYNWLKSAYVNASQTHNYATSTDPATRFDHMRRFFRGQFLPAYTDETKTSTNQIKSQEDRDAILGAVCNPNNVKKDSNFSYSCAPCPEAGTVGPSYVHTDYSASSLLIPNSWKFHSIADCYVSEFEDATGSFIYVPLNLATETVSDIGKSCYYGDSVSINDFKKHFMGSSIGSVRTDTAVSAPAQKYEDAPTTSK